VFRISVDFSALKKKKTVKTLDQSDEIYLLKMFQDSLLKNIILRGISGIKNVLPREVKNLVTEKDGKFMSKTSWVLDTTGTNLLDMFALDYIDTTKTYSNDIAEIFNILGIEATRQSIFNETEEVMETSGSIYINYHHLSVLCDRITSNKNLVPIFRTGILSDDIGPIAKATFEVQTDVFLEAARHGEYDSMRGVSANVMCGQTGFYGTHAFRLIADLHKFKEVKVSEKLDPKKAIHLDEALKFNKEECMNIREIPNLLPNNVAGIAPDACYDDGYDMGF
jgi:DNA-directed RNA polymerase II subunit RPB1